MFRWPWKSIIRLLRPPRERLGFSEYFIFGGMLRVETSFDAARVYIYRRWHACKSENIVPQGKWRVLWSRRAPIWSHARNLASNRWEARFSFFVSQLGRLTLGTHIESVPEIFCPQVALFLFALSDWLRTSSRLMWDRLGLRRQFGFACGSPMGCPHRKDPTHLRISIAKRTCELPTIWPGSKSGQVSPLSTFWVFDDCGENKQDVAEHYLEQTAWSSRHFEASYWDMGE